MTMRISYGPEALHYGDLRLPDGPGPHPVVMVIHGGAWRAFTTLDDVAAIASDLAGRGLATWNVEFRRVGDPGGGWPGTFQDVALAADALRRLAPEHGLDLERVLALGHSTGGHLAFWLAARPRFADGVFASPEAPLPLRGVVGIEGVLDMEAHWHYRQTLDAPNSAAGVLGGSPTEVPERYALTSPLLLAPLGVPQLVVYGDRPRDSIAQNNRRYVDRARAVGDPVQALEVSGVDHLEIREATREHWPAVAAAIEGLLR